MHSYKSLAVLAFAVSTASTAYSAPVQESQQQARSVIGGPLNIGRDDLPGRLNVTDILYQLSTHPPLAPGLPRDTVDLDQRASASGLTDLASDVFHSSLAKNLFSGLVTGAAGTLASIGASKLLNSTRRDFPLDLSDCSRPNQNGAGVCNEQDDVLTRDIIDALQFLKRQLIELD